MRAVCSNATVIWTITPPGCWLSIFEGFSQKSKSVVVFRHKIWYDYSVSFHMWIEEYMALHRQDKNADQLWLYFRRVIEWVEAIFPIKKKEMKGIEWGLLYKRFKDTELDLDALERQGGICLDCQAAGKPKVHYDFDEMEADHITPWSRGGRTVPENCKMRCRECNRRKSDT